MDTTRKILCSSIYDKGVEIARLKYIIIDKSFIENYPRYDFLVDDMVHVITEGLANRLIYVTEVFVHKDYRMRYFGSELLSELARTHNNDVIILRAGALISEYPEEPTDEEMNTIVSSLISFFNKSGFVSINQYCGFDNSEAMLYIGNDKGRDTFYDLLITGNLTKPSSNIHIKKYTWKDVVKIGNNVYCEEFPISGEKDGDCHRIDDFILAVAKKYNVDTDDVETYMMDNINFDARELPFGAESCGCYIDGVPEWTDEHVAQNTVRKVGKI